MKVSLLAVVVTAMLGAAAAAHAHPGGGQIVFASDRADGVRELYVVNGDGSGERRLTFNDILERQPVW